MAGSAGWRGVRAPSGNSGDKNRWGTLFFIKHCSEVSDRGESGKIVGIGLGAWEEGMPGPLEAAREGRTCSGLARVRWAGQLYTWRTRAQCPFQVRAGLLHVVL